MRVHFIAIGGSAMHNLAIALKKKGYEVSGSDDEIFEPSKSRLKKHGILPEKEGWDPSLISNNIEAVILGMHARPDNPELLKAQEIGLKIYSYPEFLYEQTKNKTRIVIGGSHGKTTITSMIMHVLKQNGIKFDFMVGAQLEGFETMVELNPNSEIAVFEGDEYLSSPIDRRPKFHLYKPHIALISGIAWDHINVFPTFENYVDQFRIFTKLIEPRGSLIYFKEDKQLTEIVSEIKNLKIISYGTHEHKSLAGKTSLTSGKTTIPLSVFGEHNLQNISGALAVCNQIGISNQQFYDAISTFKGAARRLQILANNNSTTVFFDFAHSPSKLKATTAAVKNQFPKKKLIACMELHTFSSLKKEFLPQYKGCIDAADLAFVYFNPGTVKHKKLESISTDQVYKAFEKKLLEVFTDSNKLFQKLRSLDFHDSNLLLMSSGNFDGKNIKLFATEII